MTINYTAGIVGDQVVFTLTKFVDPPFEAYESEDGFLSIQVTNGGFSGSLGYGRLEIWICDGCLPQTLVTPHYEHAEDLADIMVRITTNMEALINGNVLP